MGGGHAHVAVLRSFGMRPLPGVRITLVTPSPHTAYRHARLHALSFGFPGGLLYGHGLCHQLTDYTATVLLALTQPRLIKPCLSYLLC